MTAQPGPRDPFHHLSVTQMKKVLILADPQVTCAAPGDGTYFSLHGAAGSEPAISQDGKSATRGHPNPIAKIVKEGPDPITLQRTCHSAGLPLVRDSRSLHR